MKFSTLPETSESRLAASTPDLRNVSEVYPERLDIVRGLPI